MSQPSYKIPRVACYQILFVCGVQGVGRFGLYSHIQSWNLPPIKNGVLVSTCGRNPGGKGPFSLFLFLFFFFLFYVLNFYFDNPYPSTHSHPQIEHPRLSNLSGLTDEDIKPVPLYVFLRWSEWFFFIFLNGQMTA